MSDASDATATPWGLASELKQRKLHPGSGVPREEVIRNQRERLFGAVVAVASEKGYEATTVADVIELSGVSRSDFYRHFTNKAECLAAAAEALLEPTIEALREAGRGDDAQAAFERFIGLVTSQPAAAQVCFVELHAAGKRGEAVADRGFEALAEIAEEVSTNEAGDERISPELARVLLGGLGKLIQTHLYRGRVAELGDLAPDLWHWLRSVQAPPRGLEAPRRQRSGSKAKARFEGYTPAERIARAVAAVVAEKGYGAMSTDDIAARAAISLSTFYENFADKRDAVLAALEMSGAQIMALAGPAARRAGNWQQGVRALNEAMCAYFVAEPEMAELAMVGVYGAGPAALARRDRVIDSLAEMLAPGFEENPEAPAVCAEAAGAAVYALMREQVRSKGPESLPTVVPLATYITLVGFVGPDRAAATANGERS